MTMNTKKTGSRYTEGTAWQTGRGALARQIEGRVLLSAAVSANAPADDKWGYKYQMRTVFAETMQAAGHGTEYRMAMTLMGLKDHKEVLRVIMEKIVQCQKENTEKCTAEKAAATRILNHLWLHKQNLDRIWLLRRSHTACMQSYISAFAGALSAGAETLFLSLDGDRLTHALNKTHTDPFKLFQMLPYFEDTGYIFHIMGSRELRNAFERIYMEEMTEKEKRMLGSKEFLSSRILTGVTTHFAKHVISICTANSEASRFLKYLACSFPKGQWDHAAWHTRKIREAEPCIQILEKLKGMPDRRLSTLRLMDETKYSRNFIRALDRKISADLEQYICETEGMAPCMTAAWVLGKKNVLAFREDGWWNEDYEETILYALVHKWDRFLDKLTDNEKLREAAIYLRFMNYQINANLLSDSQLIRVCEQDMLSKDNPIPEWMRPATYDQILTWREIQGARNKENREFLTWIFKDLVNNLRPEVAGKRMFQFAQAWNGSGAEAEDYEDDAGEITSCLMEKDLYAWSAQAFRFRASHALAAMSLSYIRSTPAFKEAETEQDAWFILRNPELCKEGLGKAKEAFCITDHNVLSLKKTLRLDDEFYERYKKESMEFFLASTDIANTYACSLNDKDLKKFRLVVKAAMCGKLGEVKFHDGDLASEIGIQVDSRAAEAWIHDLRMTCGDKFRGECAEDSSFNGIMSIGSRMGHTCMNYLDGEYKECLMSYFDANKKILYRMDGQGKAIARAVLRFTKAVDADANDIGRLDFADVENVEERPEEFPILFLERMYSGYQGKDRKILAESLVKAARKKAQQIEAMLVLARDYADILGDEPESFEPATLAVYITKSKSSAQYLDSFGGKKTYSLGEDSFMKAGCLLCKD